MTVVYPVIISPKEDDGWHVITIPDLYEYGTGTQGRNLADAIYMARDFIGLTCIELQDEGKPLPAATPLEAVDHTPGDIVTLIDVDLKAYRKSLEQGLDGVVQIEATYHVNLPDKVMEELNLKPDDYLSVEVDDGSIVLTPVTILPRNQAEQPQT